MTDEAANNLLLSSSLSNVRPAAGYSSGRSPGISYFAVHLAGKPVAAAMNVSERRMLLSVCEQPAAKFMGESLGKRGLKIHAVLGPEAASESFAFGFASDSVSTKLSPKQKLLQLILHARDLNPSSEQTSPTGLWRVARKKDQRLIYTWTRQFVEECQHDESPRESEELVHRYLSNRQLFLWEDNIGPVAMAGFSGLTPNGARINMVYTEQRARSRGYAGALVSAVNRRLLAHGERKFCFLFVDSLNQPAIRAYRRIGFQQFGTFSDLR